MEFLNTYPTQTPVSKPFTNKLSLIDKERFTRFLSVRRYLADNTIRHCIIRFKVIQKWMNENNKDFNKYDIEDFVAYLRYEKQLKTNSIISYFYTLYQIELYLLDERLIDIPVINEFRRPTKPKLYANILTLDEVERIINVKRKYLDRNGVTNDKLEFFYTTFITFLALTGCRFSEGANLKVKNLDFESDKAIIELSKFQSTREVYFAEPLKSKLAELIVNKKKNDYVFSYAGNQRLKQQTFSAELKKRAQLAKIKKRVYPHLFRHSFATQLLIAGVELSYVSSLMGHRSIDTTYDTYVHLANARRKQAMFMHPLIRKSQNIKAVIHAVKSHLHSFRLDVDDRFNYEIKETNTSFSFKLKSKSRKPKPKIQVK